MALTSVRVARLLRLPSRLGRIATLLFGLLGVTHGTAGEVEAERQQLQARVDAVRQAATATAGEEPAMPIGQFRNWGNWNNWNNWPNWGNWSNWLNR